MGQIFLKVGCGILIIALVMIGILAIFLAASSLWSYIQDCLYEEWGFKLPPRKDEWFCKWLNTGEVTKDVVPLRIMKCGYCDYKTTTMSRCCPNCGRYMENWDLEWNDEWYGRKGDDLE